MVEPCPKCDTKVLDHGGRKKEGYYQVGFRCPKCGMKWTVLYGLRPLEVVSPVDGIQHWKGRKVSS